MNPFHLCDIHTANTVRDASAAMTAIALMLLLSNLNVNAEYCEEKRSKRIINNIILSSFRTYLELKMNQTAE